MLAIGDVREPVRFVIDGVHGSLVLSVPRHTMESRDWMLMLPEESPEALQLLLEPSVLNETRHGHAIDRFLATHGRALHPCWASGTLLGARLERAVIDAEDLDLRNPLHADEPRLCRTLNADRAALATVCRRVCGRGIEQPLAVGVDPLGIDVRTTFGIVRVEFPSPATTAPAATTHIESFLRPLP